MILNWLNKMWIKRKLGILFVNLSKPCSYGIVQDNEKISPEIGREILKDLGITEEEHLERCKTWVKTVL